MTVAGFFGIVLSSAIAPGLAAPSFRGARSANQESSHDTSLSQVFYVYLMASQKDGTLYLGVTRNLVRRAYEHREKLVPGFTSRYDIRRLVWFEVYDDPTNAITREKEIKKWRRAWKIALIEKDNPDWKDLYPEIVV
jgi:putative endonuclease